MTNVPFINVCGDNTIVILCLLLQVELFLLQYIGVIFYRRDECVWFKISIMYLLFFVFTKSCSLKG